MPILPRRTVVPRITYLDFSAEDPNRAIKFYAAVFGWEITKWEGPTNYWLIKTGAPSQPGIDAGLAKRSAPGQFTTPFIDVRSIDEFTAKVVAADGTIVTPKTTIPGVGYIAAFLDPEGNTIGLLQSDPDAQ